MFGQRIYLDIDFMGPIKSLDERGLHIDLSTKRFSILLLHTRRNAQNQCHITLAICSEYTVSCTFAYTPKIS